MGLARILQRAPRLRRLNRLRIALGRLRGLGSLHVADLLLERVLVRHRFEQVLWRGGAAG
jgi:hypothetical protein